MPAAHGGKPQWKAPAFTAIVRGSGGLVGVEPQVQQERNHVDAIDSHGNRQESTAPEIDVVRQSPGAMHLQDGVAVADGNGARGRQPSALGSQQLHHFIEFRRFKPRIVKIREIMIIGGPPCRGGGIVQRRLAFGILRVDRRIVSEQPRDHLRIMCRGSDVQGKSPCTSQVPTRDKSDCRIRTASSPRRLRMAVKISSVLASIDAPAHS